MKESFVKTVMGLLVALLAAPNVFAREYVCSEMPTKDIKVVSRFNSVGPHLEQVIQYLKPDGSVKEESKSVFLSPTTACSKTVDFVSNCSVQVFDDKLGYDYKFLCFKGNVRGSFYVSENGDAELYCDGQSPTLFMNCEAQQ